MEVLSPELALVDEALGSAARAALPDHDVLAPRSVPAIQTYRTGVLDVSREHGVVRSESRPIPWRFGVVGAISCAATLCAIGAFLVTPGDANRRTPAQPVAHIAPNHGSMQMPMRHG